MLGYPWATVKQRLHYPPPYFVVVVVVVVEVLSICCGHGETGETPFHIPPVATFNRDERNKESISRSTHGKMEHQSGTWKNQLN